MLAHAASGRVTQGRIACRSCTLPNVHQSRVSVAHQSASSTLKSAAAPKVVTRRRAHLSLPAVGASTSDASTSTPAAPSEDLLLLDHTTFYQYLEAAGDTLVVVDFFTDWCGPCKVIYPELLKLAKNRPDIRVVKFNCNRANKELGVKLAIKVAPTFHLYKNSVKVSEMTGAKLEQLMALIDKACEPAAA